MSDRIINIESKCKECGRYGAHYCIGKPSDKVIRDWVDTAHIGKYIVSDDIDDKCSDSRCE